MEVQEVIEDIRKRGVVLSVKRGKSGKIIARPPDQITPEEREFITGHRAEVIAYLENSQSGAAPAPESESVPGMPESAEYNRGHAAGYALGVQHAMEEFQAKTAAVPGTVPDPKSTPPTTPDQEIAQFKQWQMNRSPYYWWEEEPCMRALRDALRDGDRLVPRYAYSVYIIRADGSEEEFERRPPKAR